MIHRTNLIPHIVGRAALTQQRARRAVAGKCSLALLLLVQLWAQPARAQQQVEPSGESTTATEAPAPPGPAAPAAPSPSTEPALPPAATSPLATAAPGEAPAATEAPAPSAVAAIPDLTWRSGDVWFRPGGVLQLRYTLNERPELSGDTGTTSRFSVPRVRAILNGGLTDYLSFRVRLGVLSGGNARFEQAYSDVKLSEYLSLRAGILFLPASIGDDPAPQDLQGIDYSQYGLQTSGGNAAAAGARATFGRVRAQAYFSNGLRTGFSEFAAPVAASVAVTGRVEARLLTEDGFNRFDTESSFIGSDLALRVGAAAHYQKGRSDGTLPDGDLQQYTADVSLEGSGFNLLVAGRLLRVHPDTGNTTLDPGLLAQAGVFINERLEFWTRYDALFSDGQVHSFPDDRNGLQDNYQAIGAGINGYLIPGRNMAKLQADFTYVPDPIASTWADASDNSGVLLTETDSQWALRLQLVLGY
jgi:hypothetical protein